MTPRISFVLPVFNVESYLEEAVKSLLEQTMEDLELIVIDGGSTDRSLEIIASFGDSRVRILEHRAGGDIHRWFVESLNEGMKAARAEVIARMDADDVCDPRRIERQLSVLEQHPELVVLGTGMSYLTARGAIGSARHSGELLRSTREGTRIRLPSVVHGSAVFRKSVVLSLGGYRNEFKKAEDLDLWYRAAEVGTVGVLDEPLYFYRVHPQSLIATVAERGDHYSHMARLCSAQRLRDGEDVLQRTGALPKARIAGWRYRRWEADIRNALVLAVEGRRLLSLPLAARAAVLRPWSRASWSALRSALIGSVRPAAPRKEA